MAQTAPYRRGAARQARIEAFWADRSREAEYQGGGSRRAAVEWDRARAAARQALRRLPDGDAGKAWRLVSRRLAELTAELDALGRDPATVAGAPRPPAG